MAWLVLLLVLHGALAAETLYNGIVLPSPWPPRDRVDGNRAPMPVPYLQAPPEVIPIDIGRQLFVDDFLIESATLQRTWHLAAKYQGNPILKPETELEFRQGRSGSLPGACPHSGGAWYDPKDRLFKMWYMTGWYAGTAYVTSQDGLSWQRPDLGFLPGTNHVPDPRREIGWGAANVRLDLFTDDPAQRWKSLYWYHEAASGRGARLHTSPDGLRWSLPPVHTGPSGDRNQFFFNPFRKKWVFSIKKELPDAAGTRIRHYHEADSFFEAGRWEGKSVPWTGADDLDPPDPAVGDPTQLYDLDANAYESLIVGIFQIHKGPHNRIATQGKFPKMTELYLGYTRDGFHWHRPDRRPFIAATRKKGHWERAYVHSVAGGFLAVGDRLFFYYNAFSGEGPGGPDIYAGCSTGIAFLRRDGFASMDADAEEGMLTTRKVRFRGHHLFVNVDNPAGELRAEALDGDGMVIAPFTRANCEPVRRDSTVQRVRWKGAADLSRLSGRDVRFRFYLKQGRLYSFWVSPDSAGHSYGYLAAGGPGMRGPVDSPDGK